MPSSVSNRSIAIKIFRAFAMYLKNGENKKIINSRIQSFDSGYPYLERDPKMIMNKTGIKRSKLKLQSKLQMRQMIFNMQLQKVSDNDKWHRSSKIRIERCFFVIMKEFLKGACPKDDFWSQTRLGQVSTQNFVRKSGSILFTFHENSVEGFILSTELACN